MDKIKTEDYIDALRQLLEKRYPSSVYSLDGYQECAVCIQSENGYWTVYSAERGNRYDEVICDTVLKACLEFILVNVFHCRSIGLANAIPVHSLYHKRQLIAFASIILFIAEFPVYFFSNIIASVFQDKAFSYM